ncbi:MAG: hypothetical protein U0871_28110 [Gemmataceae bacterium]
MTPEEVAASYDQIAGRWVDASIRVAGVTGADAPTGSGRSP